MWWAHAQPSKLTSGLMTINHDFYFDESIFRHICAHWTKCHFDKVTFRRNGSLDEVSLSVVMWWAHDQQSKLTPGLMTINHDFFFRWNCSTKPSFDIVPSWQSDFETKWFIRRSVVRRSVAHRPDKPGKILAGLATFSFVPDRMSDIKLPVKHTTLYKVCQKFYQSVKVC